MFKVFNWVLAQEPLKPLALAVHSLKTTRVHRGDLVQKDPSQLFMLTIQTAY